jgi:hypothetical protein
MIRFTTKNSIASDVTRAARRRRRASMVATVVEIASVTALS